MFWISEYEYTLRLNYDLNEKSVVFDLGGYLGWFTEQIHNKYHPQIYCFEPVDMYYSVLKTKFGEFDNIKIFNSAISDRNGKGLIYLNNDASSMHLKVGTEYTIDCVTMDNVLSDNNIDKIDLIEINIEGEEYSLLKYMIDNDLIKICENIQVQFHKIGNDYLFKYHHIKRELEKTHKLTYHFPFVWENWERIK